MSKLSLSIKKTTAKGEGRKSAKGDDAPEESAFMAFDPEVRRLDYQTLYDRIDPKIKELDDSMRKKEEVKWRL